LAPHLEALSVTRKGNASISPEDSSGRLEVHNRAFSPYPLTKTQKKLGRQGLDLNG